MDTCPACGSDFDEDHEATDCMVCDRTYQRCAGRCPHCGTPVGSDYYDRENDPRWGDHIDDQIDRIKEARMGY